MNGIGIACLPVRSRLALATAGILALLGSFATPAHAQYGYDAYYNPNPCGYRCGGYYPAYRYYPYRRHYGCYSCRPHLIYERRYVEREYVERRYGYGGYRRHYGYPYGYGRRYGYTPYGGYRPSGYGYGYAGIGRRWPAPYFAGYGSNDGGYGEPPRPPAPVYDQGEY